MRALSSSSSLFVVLVASSAWAGSQVCFDAAVDGQRQRDAGKLLAARAQLIVCAKSACPDEVQKDCARWLSEVEAAIPTVVFGARDGSGNDLTDVRVSVDGSPVGDTAQGKSVSLDPGAHKVKFERAGSATVEQTLVVRAGEKNRSVVAEIQVEASAAPVPTATWALGGLGIVSLGVFTYFGLHGISERDRLGCDSGCSGSDKSHVDRQLLIADVALAISVASLATATVVWLTRSPTKSTPTVGLVVAPAYTGFTVRF